MTILLTGGTGTTATRIASLLSQTSHDHLTASRSAHDTAVNGDSKHVRFDWLDRSTYGAPFSHPRAKSRPITAVYIVPPPIADLLRHVSAFVEVALSHGVRRFVLLSASSAGEGGPMHGQVHQYLHGLEREGRGVEWAALRPTWFMQNFSEPQHSHVAAIRGEDTIYSATGNGRVPFVSADDIAAIATRVLTQETAPNCEYLVLGPELLRYDDVAQILSRTLGREIKHKKLTVQELADRFKARGLPPAFASMLASLDGGIANGDEDRLDGAVERVLGRKLVRFEDYAESVKDVWKKA